MTVRKASLPDMIGLMAPETVDLVVSVLTGVGKEVAVQALVNFLWSKLRGRVSTVRVEREVIEHVTEDSLTRVIREVIERKS